MLATDQRDLSGPALETLHRIKMSHQRDRAIADIRLADADEIVAGAEVKAAIENSFDIRDGSTFAELTSQSA
jgi:hypothetical protein